MKRQFHRMRQQLPRQQGCCIPPFHLQIEQRIEPAKRAAHSVSKRLQACLQGQCGSEMDKRVVTLFSLLSLTASRTPMAKYRVSETPAAACPWRTTII
uniref:Uncharacterized protein n=1 Tax=Nothoprocta perdicaria TaxID=30464 RepID=A0A8C6ZSR1_NOTPE